MCAHENPQKGRLFFVSTKEREKKKKKKKKKKEEEGERDKMASDDEHDIPVLVGNHKQRRSQQRKERALAGEIRPISRLFVLGFPKGWDEQKLADTFSEVGPVRRVVVMRTADGVSKGCGLVFYALAPDAATAIKTFNGKKPPGCTNPLKVELAKQI